MRRVLERAVERWLRAVAPQGWADSVVGDLAEEGVRPGILPQARIAARFTLDALSSWRPDVRRVRDAGGPMLATELRHAGRALRRSPGFALTAIVTLALAVGANTAIYSALRALVLRPLPFAESERLVFIWHRNPEMDGLLVTPSRRAIARWRGLTHIFEAVESFETRSLVIVEGGEPADISVSFVDPSTLRMLGARPALGRELVEGDSDAGAAPVALVSHRLWQERFGGDRHLAGQSVTLSGTPHTIVGVMPPRFDLPMGSDSIWAAASRSRPDTEGENTIAKLREGVTIDRAQSALNALGTAGADDELKEWSGQLMAPGDYNGTQIRRVLYVLGGAVGLLLLMACVNVANLVLTRNAARQRELALRLAIGCSRGRLSRHVLVEALVLAGAGALAGLLVAHLCLDLMMALRPANLEILDRVSIDRGDLAFVVCVSGLTAVLFGLGPAVTASRIDLQSVLKSGGVQTTPSSLRVRRLLAVAQIALALMLVIGASLLLRSYARLTAVDPGFDPAGVLSVRISLPADRYPAKEGARRGLFFDELLARVRALPGVTSAALGNGIPPQTGVMLGRLEVEGRPTDPRNGLFSGGYVSPAYFSTLRIPILEGREFAEDDTRDREPVVIVGRSLAQQLWGAASPLGARLRIQSTAGWATVVGVARDVKSSGRSWPQLYFPRGQRQPGFGALILRTSGDPSALVPAVKAAVWAGDPKLPLRDVATAEQVIRRSTSQARFNMALLGAFAACGLLLAVVGVYGVMALFVGQRQREIGIRMALGASRGKAATLVIRQSAAVLLGGLVLGTLGAAALSTYLQSLLYEISAHDVRSFIAACAAIAFAAAAATGPLVVRAGRVNPTLLLRAE